MNGPNTSGAEENKILKALGRSSFRSRFKLDSQDRRYIEIKGLSVLRSHAVDFITKRLAPAEPVRDGKQTPFRGHPVFKAQHATAACCRGCLLKWHRIPKGRALRPEEIEKLVELILLWIRKQIS